MAPQSASFRILSHAGLLVSAGGKNLVFDPWLVGSAYWRSWWNYPPVDPAVFEGLRADYLYLTQIRWDHFHGPTLRKFPRDTPILIPRLASRRMHRDLEGMGFTDIRELSHGASAELAPGFKVTSYHFFPFNDSGAMVEADGTVLFNANHGRFTGGPLDWILRRHPRIDFVFRGHGPDDDRICFDYIDSPARRREDPYLRLEAFAAFAEKTGARYAIPFATGYCHLHKETMHLNDAVVTPDQVVAHCRGRADRGFEANAMVAGDSWSATGGFAIADGPWFRDRDRCLTRYAAAESERLERFDRLEASVDVSQDQLETYFRRFRAALPGFALKQFEGRPITLVLTGKTLRRFWVDLEKGIVKEVGSVDDENHPMQIYTSSYILRRCMALDLFHFLGTGKRVLFRVRREDAKWIHLLLILFNLYGCEMLPLRKLMAPRFWLAWAPRWREAVLYAGILLRHGPRHPFIMEDYLRPKPVLARQVPRSQAAWKRWIFPLKRMESPI